MNKQTGKMSRPSCLLHVFPVKLGFKGHHRRMPTLIFKYRNTSFQSICVLGIGLGTLALLSPAHADLTLVIEQSATAAQTAPVPRTLTVLLHSGNARLEVSQGPIFLYEGKDGTVETLQPMDKTYDMTFLAELQQAEDPLPPGSGDQITTNLQLDLRKTDQTETIAGVTAQKYLVVGRLSYTRPEQQGGRHGKEGDRRGGGSDGGGNAGEGDKRRHLLALPHFSLGGEIWLSDAVKLPADKDATTFPLVQLAAAGAKPFWQTLADTLDKKKEIPLAARITFTKTTPADYAQVTDAYGGVTTYTATPASTTTATTMTVQSIAQAPLDAGLFEAPTDYRLIAAPVTPVDPGLP
jgi:hypothetical protein